MQNVINSGHMFLAVGKIILFNIIIFPSDLLLGLLSITPNIRFMTPYSLMVTSFPEQMVMKMNRHEPDWLCRNWAIFTNLTMQSVVRMSFQTADIRPFRIATIVEKFPARLETSIFAVFSIRCKEVRLSSFIGRRCRSRQRRLRSIGLQRSCTT